MEISTPYLIPRLLLELSGDAPLEDRVRFLHDETRDQTNPLMLPRDPPRASLPHDSTDDPTALMTSKILKGTLNKIVQHLQSLPRSDPRGVFDLKGFRRLQPRLFGLGESWVLLFLRNFPHLASLDLSYNGLSQSFVDRLAKMPGLAASLNKLVLFERVDQNLIANFEFLYAFRRLRHFHSNLLFGPPIEGVISSLPCPALFVYQKRLAGTVMICDIEIRKYRTGQGLTRYDMLLLDKGIFRSRKNGLELDKLQGAMHTVLNEYFRSIVLRMQSRNAN